MLYQPSLAAYTFSADATVYTAMPIIDLTLSQGVFNKQQKSALAEQLTRCLLNCDVTRDNPRAPAINWCYLHELPEGHVYIAGAEEKRPHYRIEITIMQQAMSEDVKAQVVADMTRTVLAMEGQKANPLSASRVWVIFHEIADGNWGAAGKIYRLEELRAYLNGQS
jgi:phenylpyruvate tautomerase PptA (4-oxalocrotonate tautomerase family)